jgi:hypothetical protein
VSNGTVEQLLSDEELTTRSDQHPRHDHLEVGQERAEAVDQVGHFVGGVTSGPPVTFSL